ncbi:MAG: hypothetical protein M1514_03960 [Patescibacteria group bacterium]|nr:hypothetical protein [Patescibacteria group bacterium]
MQNFQKKFPVFSAIFSQTNFSGYAFIFIYHLNDNNLPFLKKWTNNVKTLGIISIPYSEVKKVKVELQKGSLVFTPQTISEIPDLILKLAQKYSKEKIVLVEVGGYSSYVSSNFKNVFLTIEDTHQGYWLQQDNQQLTCPVVSIANTDVKKVENRIVGESIVKTVERLIKKYKNINDIREVTFSILSYGGIGSSVCLALRNRQVIPYVYDIDPIKMSQALADGYRITSREKMLSISNVIIGCSGKLSLSIEDLNFVKPGCYLFSGSSKQVEFESFLGMFKGKRNSEIQEAEYQGKSFWVGYSCQPINFLDKIKPEMFDVILAAMVECFNYGTTNKLENKVYSLPLENQKKILELFINSQCF